MDNLQIEHILNRALKGTRVDFLGVFSSDTHPKLIDYPCCYVANTDPQHKPGTHWLAFYYSSPDSLDFFDSYGVPPRIYSVSAPTYLETNSHSFQGLHTDVCGHYCIYFLFHRCRHLSLHSIVNTLIRCGRCTDHCIKEFVNQLIDSNYHKIPKLCTSQKCKVRMN